MATRAVSSHRQPTIVTPKFQQTQRWRVVQDKAGQLLAARIFLGLAPSGESFGEA